MLVWFGCCGLPCGLLLTLVTACGCLIVFFACVELVGFLGSVMVLCLWVLFWVSWLVVMLVICLGCEFGLFIVVAGCAVLVANLWWFWFDFGLLYWCFGQGWLFGISWFVVSGGLLARLFCCLLGCMFDCSSCV